MILKFSVHTRAGLDQPDLVALRSLLSVPDLRTWRDYYIEVATPVSEEALEQLRCAIGDDLTEVVRLGEPIVPGEMVQVAYQTGIVDNENDSLVALARLCGVGAHAARVARTFGSTDDGLAERVREHCMNPNIETLYDTEPLYHTLHPTGVAVPPERFDLLVMDDAELGHLGLSSGRNLNLDQMRVLQRAQADLGLPSVTDVLIEAADARWSDHCLHTTWKALDDLLGRLTAASRALAHPNALSMFDDNAGVWSFYDGWAIAIKAETHSGPSAVSAYFGQLTKLGGVLRDILGTGLGADPIGSFEYTATGLLDSPSPVPGRPSPRQIALETVRAVKEYGNTFGVPMMTSHMTFHPAFRAKPFALGGSIGLIPSKDAKRGQPQPGDMLMVIGGLTGNDGIHGASASSAGAEMDAAAVQIGAPLEQVKFRQAIVDLRDTGCLRALTDVGGAGLNSAIGEIGDPGGVWFNTALVPLKTAGLPTWRILLSESQERMVLAIIPATLATARQILDRHAVRHTIVGRFTDTARYCVVHIPEFQDDEVIAAEPSELPSDNGTGFDIPYESLEYRPSRITVAAPAVDDRGTGTWPDLDVAALAALMPRLMAHPELACQRYASAQYDTTVMGHTVYGPDAGDLHVPTSFWAGTPVAASAAAVVFTAAYNPWLFECHPSRATRQMFLQVVLRQVAAGVAPSDVCVCDNFYTPHLSTDGFAWLVAMVDELCRLIDLTGVPVVSGKDSSAGSVVTPEGIISVPPSVYFSAVGKVVDAARLVRNEWISSGNLIVLVGPPTASTAGTVAGRLLGVAAAGVDLIDVTAFRGFLVALHGAKNSILSARPVGEGGAIASLALSALGGELGAQLDVGAEEIGPVLLAEHRCAALIEIRPASLGDLPPALMARAIGRVIDKPGVVYLDGVDLAENISAAWLHSWEEHFA